MQADTAVHRGGRSRTAISSLLILFCVLSAVTLIRWRLLRETPYPTGPDGGNWLAFGHSLFGERIRSAELVYPPVVPFLAVAFERLFGTYRGIEILAIASSWVPALGTYVLLYGWGLGWRAAVVAGFLAASAGTGEAMAWGGFPQLIGLGILPLFILALDRFLTSKALWPALPTAFFLLAAFATSDLVAPVTALVGLLYLAGRYGFLLPKERGNSAANIAIGSAITVVVCLPLLPVYLNLLPGVASVQGAILAGHPSTLNALGALSAATQDVPTFWDVALVAALILPIVAVIHALRSRRHPPDPVGPLVLLSTTIIASSAALLFGLGQNRFAYFAPLGIALSLGAWWAFVASAPGWARRTLDAALITCLVLDVAVGTQYFAFQRSYYTILNPDLVSGISEIQVLSGPSQLIAVSPTIRDWELGWWVEGAARRRTIYAGDPIWLSTADERTRNAIANSVFSVDLGLQGSIKAAREAGAAYIFIDKSWPGYAMWDSNRTNVDSRAIVYENQTVLIAATGS